MEKLIASKQELIEKIKDLRAVEALARDSYAKDEKIFANITIINMIDRIKNDEVRHILLLEEILDLLEKK
jgi:hypothetical protein